MRGLRRYSVLLVAVVAICLVSLSSAAAPRSLYWRELAVNATHDREGRLQVNERHVMVFSGAWNGGERWFSLDGDQEVELRSLVRIAAGGQRVRLTEGDLSHKDEYAITRASNAVVIRWRSRLPSEPEFQSSELVYEISYVFSNVLREGTNGVYRLNHNFVPPERPGLIEHFSLKLMLDPIWQTLKASPLELTRSPVGLGELVVSQLELRFRGQGRPAGVSEVASPELRSLAAVALLGVVALLVLCFFRRERRLGRLALLVPIERIGEPWLRLHVFSLAPELVATIDARRVSARAVAALIARFTVEGKLGSRVRQSQARRGRDELDLWLLVPRSSFADHERELIDQLFFSGDTTSTEGIRAHYRLQGFYPTRVLRRPLDQLAKGELGRERLRFSAGLLVLAGVITYFSLLALEQSRSSQLPAIIGWQALVAIGGCALAYSWTLDMASAAAGTLRFLVPLGLNVFSCLIALAAFDGLSSLGVWSLVLVSVTSAGSILFVASSRQASFGIALRKSLRAARNYFESELERAEPRLRDAWYPYLVALGLQGPMARWLGAFRVAQPSASSGNQRSPSWSSSFGSESPAEASWSGGGGSFGGAGAGGSWLDAVGVITSGVASPSSSSSVGGSSSSSSTSGGGGAGGW